MKYLYKKTHGLSDKQKMKIIIVRIMDGKIAAIQCHKSQASGTDFVGLAKGLNRYRAIASGQSIQYAEAFFVASKKDFIEMFRSL